MKKASIMMAALALLLACIGAAFQAGRNSGFTTGSEWALMQADIVAQEAGVFMPVYLKDGKFRVVIRQPRGIYRRAWELADQYEETKEAVRTPKRQGVHEGQEVKNNI